MVTKYITIQRLRQLRACLPARIWFTEKFGERGETREVLLAAIQHGNPQWVTWWIQQTRDYKPKQLRESSLKLVQRLIPKVINPDHRTALRESLRQMRRGQKPTLVEYQHLIIRYSNLAFWLAYIMVDAYKKDWDDVICDIESSLYIAEGRDYNKKTKIMVNFLYPIPRKTKVA